MCIRDRVYAIGHSRGTSVWTSYLFPDEGGIDGSPKVAKYVNIDGRSPDELPGGVRLVRTTRVFRADGVPAGLLSQHRVAEGVWGRLVVGSGRLRFVADDDPTVERVVVAGDEVVIPPKRTHHLELLGDVEFIIEFHR